MINISPHDWNMIFFFYSLCKFRQCGTVTDAYRDIELAEKPTLIGLLFIDLSLGDNMWKWYRFLQYCNDTFDSSMMSQISSYSSQNLTVIFFSTNFRLLEIKHTTNNKSRLGWCVLQLLNKTILIAATSLIHMVYNTDTCRSYNLIHPNT